MGKRFSREELERMLGEMGGRWLRILEATAISRGVYHGELILPAEWGYSREVKVYMENGHLREVETFP